MDVSEVFTLKFGSRGKLTLGSKKAQTTQSGTNTGGDLVLGNDTKSVGNLYLGTGANTGASAVSNISVGYIDNFSTPGFLRILAGNYSDANYHEILRLGSQAQSAFKFKWANTSSTYGGLLQIKAAPNATNPTIEATEPGIFVETASSGTDHVLKYKNSTGTHSLSHCIPLAGSSSIAGHLVPSADETYNLGSSSYKWNNLYLKRDSLYLGDSHISTSADTGSIEVSDASGNIIADSNESLQTVTGTVVLSDTSISAFSVGSTIISGDGDLKLEDGVELIIIGGVDLSPLSDSIQTNLDDIQNHASQITSLQNYTSRTQLFVETLQAENQDILNNIESLVIAHNRLRDLIIQNQNDFIEASRAINNDNYTKYEDA